MISANWKNGQGHELVLCYEEKTTGGGICKGQEHQLWPDYEPLYYEVALLSLHRPDLKQLSWNCETVYAQFNPTKAKRAHLVVVKYQDGDTFGTSHGNVYIEGAYRTKKEADRIAKSIEDDIYKGGYKAWSRYFKSLEECRGCLLRHRKVRLSAVEE